MFAVMVVVVVQFTATFIMANSVVYEGPPVQPGQPVNHGLYSGSGWSSGEKAAVVFLIFSLYWTSQVFRNISHVTTAGTVASWWLVANLERPTLGAFKRAMTTSFGTICAGSLIVAIIDTIIWLLRKVDSIGAAIIRCLLQFGNGILKWLNKYAFVEAAMYGYSFMVW